MLYKYRMLENKTACGQSQKGCQSIIGTQRKKWSIQSARGQVGWGRLLEKGQVFNRQGIEWGRYSEVNGT